MSLYVKKATKKHWFISERNDIYPKQKNNWINPENIMCTLMERKKLTYYKTRTLSINWQRIKASTVALRELVRRNVSFLRVFLHVLLMGCHATPFFTKCSFVIRFCHRWFSLWILASSRHMFTHFSISFQLTTKWFLEIFPLLTTSATDLRWHF